LIHPKIAIPTPTSRAAAAAIHVTPPPPLVCAPPLAAATLHLPRHPAVAPGSYSTCGGGVAPPPSPSSRARLLFDSRRVPPAALLPSACSEKERVGGSELLCTGSLHAGAHAVTLCLSSSSSSRPVQLRSVEPPGSRRQSSRLTDAPSSSRSGGHTREQAMAADNGRGHRIAPVAGAGTGTG